MNRMPFLFFSGKCFIPRIHLFFFLSTIIPPVLVTVVPFIPSNRRNLENFHHLLLQKLQAVYLFFFCETHLSILEWSSRGVSICSTCLS